MKQYTDSTVLLDRSGSMESIKGAMEEAFKSFITKHKEVPTSKLTLIQFDSQNPQETVYMNVPITAAEPLTLQPRGGTPLLDAFCTAIDNTGKRLSGMLETNRPDQVLFVVITDGEENSSRKHSRLDVSNRVTKQTEDYKWQFLYLGANQDAIKEAASFGIGAGYAINYTHGAIGTASAMTAVMDNSVSYTSNTLRGALAPEFTKRQRKAAVEEDKK